MELMDKTNLGLFISMGEIQLQQLLVQHNTRSRSPILNVVGMPSWDFTGQSDFLWDLMTASLLVPEPAHQAGLALEAR